MKRKEILLFNCTNADGWIGGAYYIKNILYMISQNKNILSKYKIVLTVTESTKDIFDNLEEINILELSSNKYLCFMQKIFIMLTKNVKYIYNYSYNWKKFIFNNKGIYWIADFQDKHLPQYFTEKEISRRNNDRKQMAFSGNPLILSSYDALNDFNDDFQNYSAKVYVVPFISYIEKEINSITNSYEEQVLGKYGVLTNKYIFITNQFWQHKNHIVVFKMIKILVENKLLNDYKFIFTGEIKDYRNPEYYNQLLEISNNDGVKEKVKMLGFIDRKEQLTLMKNSKLIIQPSLFEGWGTVLEDAKVLDKVVVLSDIPVHHEQMDDNCFLFNPYDEYSLMNVLIDACNKEHQDNIEKGIKNMHKRAEEYSKALEECLLSSD